MTLLYAYGKYVVLSYQATPHVQILRGATAGLNRNYMGSAIGALEECQRSSVKERQPKISYYLGKAYLEINRPVKANEVWSTLEKGSLISIRAVKEVRSFLQSFEGLKTT